MQHITKSIAYLGKQPYDANTDVHIPLNFPMSIPLPMVEELIKNKFDWPLGPWSSVMDIQQYIGAEYNIELAKQHWVKAKM